MPVMVNYSANYAASAAHRAQVAECQFVLNDYEPARATVAEMRHYASCVDTVYGREDTSPAVQVVFAIVLLLVIGWLYLRFND